MTNKDKFVWGSDDITWLDSNTSAPVKKQSRTKAKGSVRPIAPKKEKPVSEKDSIEGTKQ